VAWFDRTMLEKFGPRDYREQPWKNGLGVTLELLRAPHPSQDASAFAYRVSCAKVAESGPFSVFPGIERAITVLDGKGFCLTLSDGAEVTVERGQVACFRCETWCVSQHFGLIGCPS
jgi:environmental stress-induced protein Ves